MVFQCSSSSLKSEFTAVVSLMMTLMMAVSITTSEALTVVPSRSMEAADPFAFFKAAEGEWHGHPSATAIGPVLRDINLTVEKPVYPSTSYGAPVDEGTWSIKHWMLDFFEVTGNWQLFWVQNDKPIPSTTNSSSSTSPGGNMTFCFLIPSWVDGTVQGRFYWTRSSLTSDSVTWKFNSTATIGPSLLPWTGTWTMSLHENSTKLHSYMTMAGAAHIDVWLTRREQAGAPPLHQEEVATNKGQEEATNKGTQQQQFLDENSEEIYHHIPPRGGDLPDVCGGPILRGKMMDGLLLPRSSSSSANTVVSSTELELVKSGAKCPLGYTRGRVPQFVLDRIEAKKKRKQVQQEESTSYAGYQNCFVMNTALDLRVRWNWNEQNETMDVYFSGNLSAPSSTTSNYLAIGILPSWPYMEGMDIILGFIKNVTTGEPCVQNLYADQKFGQPVPNTQQEISNTTAWLTDNGQILNVKFSRPWNTGHHDLNTYAKDRPVLGYELAFATGSVYSFGGQEEEGNTFKTLANLEESSSSSSSCPNYTPGYHGEAARGVMAIDWKNPQHMPHFKRCENVDRMKSVV